MFSKIRNYFTHQDKKIRDNRWIFVSMLIGASLSLLASFVLSLEAVELARDPSAALNCSINTVINCATVSLHPSAHLLGFPNSFLGMIAEPVVITVAVAGLAGVKFPRLFMFAAQIGYSIGFVFALWLLYTSYFVIGALCPWCLLVTLTTTLVWFAITRYNIREENLYLPKNISHKLQGWIKKDYDKLLLWVFVSLVAIAIVGKYGADLFA